MVTVGATALYTFSQPDVYRATGRIMIEPPDPVVIQVQDTSKATDADRDYYETQYRLLKDRELAEQVFDELGAAKRPEYKELGNPVASFMRGIHVAPLKKSRLVDVGYEHTDPVWAALVATMMRPQWLERYTEVVSHGYDLMLAVDVSRSTRVEDFTVDDRRVNLLLWDLAGEDELQEIRMSYLRGAAGYVLVVDGTRVETLDTAVDLQKRAAAFVGEAPFLVLLNKTDVRDSWQLPEADIEELVSRVRRALGRSLVRPLMERDCLRVLTVAPEVEQEVLQLSDPAAGEAQQPLADPRPGRSVAHRVAQAVRDAPAGSQPAVLCNSARTRSSLRKLTESILPSVPILSALEVPAAPPDRSRNGTAGTSM